MNDYLDWPELVSYALTSIMDIVVSALVIWLWITSAKTNSPT